MEGQLSQQTHSLSTLHCQETPLHAEEVGVFSRKKIAGNQLKLASARVKKKC